MFIYDTWNPGSAITDEGVLEFTGGDLVKRWLHGPRVDEPLGFERYAGTTAPGSGTAHELIAGRLGSVLGVVDVASGQLAGAYRYDAFGARTVTGEAIRYGFTGREHDASGLIYYRARHYDSQTGRFLQADPIGFAAGDLNIYAYVWNDPFNWTDPYGLAPEWANKARAAAAGALSATATVGRGVLSLADAINRALMGFSAGMLMGSFAPGGGGMEQLQDTINDYLDFFDDLDFENCVGAGDGGQNSVYSSNDSNGDREYVGRTNDADRRAAEHSRKGRPTRTQVSGLTSDEAAIVEQALMNYEVSRFMSGQRGSLLSNIRNGRSPHRMGADAILDAAKGLLRDCMRR